MSPRGGWARRSGRVRADLPDRAGEGPDRDGDRVEEEGLDAGGRDEELAVEAGRASDEVRAQEEERARYESEQRCAALGQRLAEERRRASVVADGGSPSRGWAR